MAADASSLLRFAQKCGRMPTTVKEMEVNGLHGAALAVKKSVLTSAKSRGWPVTGKRAVRASYDILPGAALVKGTGFAAMFEKGAKSHREPRAKGRKRNHKVNIPGLGVFDHIQHPGFHGKAFWDAGVTAARPFIRKEYEKGIEIGLRKAFK